MIHGFGLSAHTWGAQFLAQLRPHFWVIRISNRGTGQTDKPDTEYSHGMMADDAAGVLGELGVDRAHVLGISMGGKIAQELALTRPEQVQGLVLGCTTCGGAHAVQPEPQVTAMLAPTPGLSPQEQARKIWSVAVTPEFQEKNRDVLDEVFEWDLENPVPAYVLARQAVASMRHDTYQRLPDLQTPTLIIHGNEDRMVPVQNAHILHERIPNSTLHTLPDTGHGFFWERPQEAAEVIVRFLSSVPAPA
jgi:pimeloyl-ACP methyl ester carboxylesterase